MISVNVATNVATNIATNVSSATSPITILGSACTGWLRGDEYTAASPPDIDQIDSLQTPGNLVLAQPGADPPHAEDASGIDVFDFTATQSISGNGFGSPICSADGFGCVYIVCSFDSMSTNWHGVAELGNNLTHNTGFLLYHHGGTGQVIGRVSGNVGSYVDAAYTFNDPGAWHVWCILCDATHARLYLGDTQVASTAHAGSGLKSDIDSMRLGGGFSGSGLSFSGQVRSVVVANIIPDAATHAELVAYLEADAGIA